jgi:hypothetical protein
MTDTTTDTPRIYVACLASYNAGILDGNGSTQPTPTRYAKQSRKC